MKKMILSVAAGVTFCAAVFTCYGVYENSKFTPQSDLIKLNLELLSQQEYKPGTRLACVKTASSAGEGSLVWIPYCTPCADVQLNQAWDPSECTVQ